MRRDVQPPGAPTAADVLLARPRRGRHPPKAAIRGSTATVTRLLAFRLATEKLPRNLQPTLGEVPKWHVNKYDPQAPLILLVADTMPRIRTEKGPHQLLAVTWGSSGWSRSGTAVVTQRHSPHWKGWRGSALRPLFVAPSTSPEADASSPSAAARRGCRAVCRGVCRSRVCPPRPRLIVSWWPQT